MTQYARETALDLIKFLDASPSPYHAAAEARRRLIAAGFAEGPLTGGWPPGAGRYVTGGGGSLFAWGGPGGAPPPGPVPPLRAATRRPTPPGQPRPGTRRAGRAPP